MPRPPGKPLISRSAAVQAAIDIIGADGLQSFTMPRLAAEMGGVKVPSLYHHFRDRADILLAVVQYVAGAAVVASGSVPGPDWPEHFVALATSFRRSFVCHKNTAPPCCCTTGHEICFRADTKPRHSSCIDRGGCQWHSTFGFSMEWRPC